MRMIILVLFLCFAFAVPAQAQYVSYNLMGAGGGPWWGGGFQSFPNQTQTFRTDIGSNLMMSRLGQTALISLPAAAVIWHAISSSEKKAQIQAQQIGYGGGYGTVQWPVEHHVAVETREYPRDEADEWHEKARVERAKETYLDDAADTLRTKSRYLEERERFEKRWGGEPVSAAELKTLREELKMTKEEVRQLKEQQGQPAIPESRKVPQGEVSPPPLSGDAPKTKSWGNPYPRDLKLRPGDGKIESPADSLLVRHASIEPGNQLYEMDAPPSKEFVKFPDGSIWEKTHDGAGRPAFKFFSR